MGHLEQRSMIVSARVDPDKRVLKKVPFVELFAGRLQGVVSSGSSIERVYVSFIAAGSGDFYCSTNNNRPCGGLRGSHCKHIRALVTNAIAQYGAERVGQYLGCASPITDSMSLQAALPGTLRKEESAMVFSRFLDYLRYVELPAPAEPLPEMAWFATG